MSLPLLLAPLAVNAQDLTPRAYLITPMGSNAVVVSYAWNDGDLVFDPSVQIENGKGTFQTPVLSYYHSFGLLGRSANIVVAQPYAVGNFQGDVASVLTKVYRSGLVDSRVRLAVNLRGGRAMPLKQFVQWRERTLIGASLTAVIPIGQYDPARAINPGTNRWAFKPEVGISRRWRRWVAEAYAGVWLFGANNSYFPGASVRTQEPMTAFEAHVGYYLKPRLWISLDGNFWNGGRSEVNGTKKQDLQKNSRAGITCSTPIDKHQSIKFSYSRGTYVTIGGDFQTIAVAWQYSWLGWPR
jgi:Putative MetA-pathway of phenol degradation